jgi:hypothetical protein
VGDSSPDAVKAVVLETDGSFRVVSFGQRSGSPTQKSVKNFDADK